MSDSDVGTATQTLADSTTPHRTVPDNLADSLSDPLAGAPVQCEGGPSEGGVRGIASEGLSDASSGLPFGEQIQSSFGRYDLSDVKVSTGHLASEACDTLDAGAYASGSKIAFGGTPSLHTAAHEAAHVVQQQKGVQLEGGWGTPGDRYEQNADAVADAVVAGESAEPLLDSVTGGGGSLAGGSAVQFGGGPEDDDLLDLDALERDLGLGGDDDVAVERGGGGHLDERDNALIDQAEAIFDEMDREDAELEDEIIDDTAHHRQVQDFATSIRLQQSAFTTATADPDATWPDHLAAPAKRLLAQVTAYKEVVESASFQLQLTQDNLLYDLTRQEVELDELIDQIEKTPPSVLTSAQRDEAGKTYEDLEVIRAKIVTDGLPTSAWTGKGTDLEDANDARKAKDQLEDAVEGEGVPEAGQAAQERNLATVKSELNKVKGIHNRFKGVDIGSLSMGDIDANVAVLTEAGDAVGAAAGALAAIPGFALLVDVVGLIVLIVKLWKAHKVKKELNSLEGLSAGQEALQAKLATYKSEETYKNGWNAGLAVVHIAGDIAILTVAGAAVGAGMKIGAGIAKAGAKLGQKAIQAGRDHLGIGPKSKTSKAQKARASDTASGVLKEVSLLTPLATISRKTHVNNWKTSQAMYRMFGDVKKDKKKKVVGIRDTMAEKMFRAHDLSH